MGNTVRHWGRGWFRIICAPSVAGCGSGFFLFDRPQQKMTHLKQFLQYAVPPRTLGPIRKIRFADVVPGVPFSTLIQQWKGVNRRSVRLCLGQNSHILLTISQKRTAAHAAPRPTDTTARRALQPVRPVVSARMPQRVGCLILQAPPQTTGLRCASSIFQPLPAPRGGWRTSRPAFRPIRIPNHTISRSKPK